MPTVAAPVAQKPNQTVLNWLSSHWFGLFVVFYGLWVLLPFLAPVFMALNLSGAGNVIYFVYSFFCHQLPERSLFFFGEKTMYTLAEIQTTWQSTVDPLVLRRFIGTDAMGWKVAWSDRMISFYGSIWLFAILWWPLRGKLRPASWIIFLFLLLPMIVDGITHTVSDFAGLGQGFRDSNQWLILLTNKVFPASFYAGDALGSFNSWMRLITGLLAGLGIVWLAFPYIFQSQALGQKLDTISNGVVREQIKSEHKSSTG